jgi:hypothetical protein
VLAGVSPPAGSREPCEDGDLGDLLLGQGSPKDARGVLVVARAAINVSDVAIRSSGRRDQVEWYVVSEHGDGRDDHLKRVDGRGQATKQLFRKQSQRLTAPYLRVVVLRFLRAFDAALCREGFGRVIRVVFGWLRPARSAARGRARPGGHRSAA